MLSLLTHSAGRVLANSSTDRSSLLVGLGVAAVGLGIREWHERRKAAASELEHDWEHERELEL
jgi:hypothetical protein